MLTEAMLLEQNKRLREENDELREAVRQLRSSLLAEDEPLPAGLPHLTRKEEATFRILLRRKGVVSKSVIYTAIYGDREAGPGDKIIDVWIFKLRRKLQPVGIEIGTEWGRGYFVVRGGEQIAAIADTGALISESLAA